jgi:hypothetical protein
LTWDELETIRDEPESLWINSDSTKTGHYDCISQDEAATVHDSLLLIRPESFAIDVGRNYWTGKKSFRGSFNYKGDYHSLSMADPIAREAFVAKEGSYPLDDIYLCISLTEPYEQDDRCHKLVAAIISRQLLK